MIRVNLVGDSARKVVKTRAKAAGPTNLLPIVLVLIFAGSAAGGYLWYATLSGANDALVVQITEANAQKAQLEAVIQQDQIYEARKTAIENRIKVIEGLRRNQVSPVVTLDALADAIDRTEFVWLSSLSQSDTLFTMVGIGTSVNAIADFVSNLENTGYFRNIDLRNAQDAAGNFTFNMTCEFVPRVPLQAVLLTSPPAGGN